MAGADLRGAGSEQQLSAAGAGRPRKDSELSTRFRASFAWARVVADRTPERAAIARTLEALKVCRDKMAARGVTRARTSPPKPAARPPMVRLRRRGRERLGLELGIVDARRRRISPPRGLGPRR
jgi:hypothetical protein